jgi:hypothetical protein
MTASPIHPDTVRKIVAEVLERIRSGVPAAAPAIAPARPAAPTLPERVLTLALLERLPAGTRSVVLLPNAVITATGVLGLIMLISLISTTPSPSGRRMSVMHRS